MGDIVIYRLTQKDAQQINRRRTTGDSIRERIGTRMNSHTEYPCWPLGAQAHIGTLAKPGMDFPMIVVRVSEAGYISGQVFLEGNDVLFVTPEFGDTDGTWHWKPQPLVNLTQPPADQAQTTFTPVCAIHNVPCVLQSYARLNIPMGNAWICPRCQEAAKEVVDQMKPRRPNCF
jgi:hypothetical protein